MNPPDPNLTNILPKTIANRVAAVAAFLTGLAATIAGIANVLPLGWQSTALSCVGVIGAIGTALHFMLGSQKSEANATQLLLAQHDAYTANLETQFQELLRRVDNTGPETSAQASGTMSFEQAEQNIPSNYTPAYAGHPNPEFSVKAT
jgi:hypothetical protein